MFLDIYAIKPLNEPKIEIGILPMSGPVSETYTSPIQMLQSVVSWQSFDKPVESKVVYVPLNRDGFF